MSDYPGLTAEQYRRMLEEEEEREAAEAEEEGSFGNRAARFFSRVKTMWSEVPEQTKLDKAVEQGARKAVNEFSNTVVSGARAAKRAVTGEDFAGWYGRRTKEVNPLQVDAEEERAPGIYGFIEGASQFAVGMAGFSKVKGIASLPTLARGAAAGALTDFSVMDPYEERLSNLAEQGPEWVKGSLTEFLAADEDDGELEGRLKASLEGLLTGATIDGIVWGAKAVRATRLFNGGKIAREEAERQLNEAVEAGTKAAEEWKEPVKALHTPGGPSEIRVNVAMFPELVDGGAAGDDIASTLTGANRIGDELVLEVATPAQAEKLAASINASWIDSQKPVDVTPEHIESAKTIFRRIDSGENIQDVLRAENGILLNHQRLAASGGAKGALNALAEAIHADRVTLAEAGGAKDGNTIPWSVQDERMRSWTSAMSQDDFIRRMATLAGVAEKMPAYVTAGRILVSSLAEEVAHLSRVTDADPNDIAAADRMTDALLTMIEIHDYTTGTVSDVARTLQMMKKRVGAEDALQFGEEGAKDAPGAPKSPKAPKGPGGNGSAPSGEPAAPKTPKDGVQLTQGKPREADALAANADLVVNTKPRKKPVQLARSDISALARQFVLSEGDPDRILKAMRMTTIAADPANANNLTLMQKVLGFRANMMLSGPLTHAVNTATGIVNSVAVPLEYMFGGLHAGVTRGDWGLSRQGADMLVAYRHVMADAGRAMYNAVRENRAILDPDHLTLDNSQVAQHALSGTAGLLNLPSRALMGMDEFFKQLTYRSHVRSSSLRNSRTAAKARGLEGKEAREFMGRRMVEDLEFSFDVNGGAVNPLALQHSRYTTFTNSLDYGVGDWLQKGANELPIIRLIFPFVRTPVNITRFAWQRFPGLGMLQRQMREDLAAGGDRRSVALARQATGLMLYGMAVNLASAGNIVGGGPENPKLRKQWLEAGNVPYSVRIGDKWVSYRRLEPLGTPLSIVADFYSITGELNDLEAEEMISSVAASMAGAISSKTFLLGMTEFFDAVSSGEEWRMRRMLTNLTLSFTPNALRQLNPDDTWRETETIMEEFKSRVPGWSSTLEPRRNIFGEQVVRLPAYHQRLFNPFTIHDPPSDYVAQQLLELGDAMPMPPEKRADGEIDLRDRKKYDNGTGQSPYDRTLELMARPRNGRSLRAALLDRMGTETWRTASREKRILMATEMVTAYHRKAQAEMEQEYPLLRQELIRTRQQEAAALRGGPGLLQAISQ